MSDKQVATMRAGGRIKPIIPESFEDVQRIATMAVRSELFKPAKRDEPAETTIARCCLAIMTGLDCGLSPAQSVQSIAVINGRCLIWGDAVPGILWAHGFDIDQRIEGEGDARAAICTITRPGGKKITRSFSVAQAKQARLWDERPTVKKKWNDKWEDKPNDSPWFRFSDRMLAWRALGFAKSDGASDVMKGLDIQQNDDSHMIDVTPERPAVLPVPTDIEDGTPQTAVVTEAEASQAKPEAEEPSAVLRAYQTAVYGARTEREIKSVDKLHKAALETLDADMGKVAEEMRAKALALVKAKPAKSAPAQGALLPE